ncbi:MULTISPECIES: papain-like cysteine protease family protein [Streptomyces]|uniref:Papain-like cysteine protease AvrRpt2 n=1 Tax=Streptomyces yunnanensis TaxID=156453 RepID=A0A9X8MY50_9ACTN|nr:MULTISPECIES: papain-like cysteine protease family protein [Streptomyces]SHM26205.1 Papain-like cysteine protease AvrRpt2 [Streptomyces yunnanensis]
MHRFRRSTRISTHTRAAPTSRRKKALLATTGAAVLSVGLLLGITPQAQASVTGTVTGGRGNFSTVNQRSQPSLSAGITGKSWVGDQIPMTCRTTGDVVENNSRWIWSGKYYIADAFIRENTGRLPVCTSTQPTDEPTGNPTGRKALDISMQKQVKDQWCWDATGLTIANFWGYTRYNQYDFCRLAAQNNRLDCNNRPATLGDMANGLRNMGFRSSGSDLYRNASFGEARTEIANGRPFAVRIGWNSGGGHMNVIYGYDSTSNMIAVGDPWPTTKTYTWWNYSTYSGNNSFRWTHTRIGIHG